ncbi:hypothetical protein ACFQ9X_42820 [Catenulispora yoronensis]
MEQSLHRRLLEVTIGGSGKNASEIDPRRRDEVFAEYVGKALPDVPLDHIETLVTGASLNSVCASCSIDGRKYLLKVHIESGAEGQGRSTLGVGHEYENAELLEQAGFPIVAPYLRGQNPDFPLLAYPWVDSDTLFDKLEQSYTLGHSTLTPDDLTRFETMNTIVGQVTDRSIREVPTAEALKAPVQALFLNRFAPGGRIDDWYHPTTVFELPSPDGTKLPCPGKPSKTPTGRSTAAATTSPSPK